LWDRGEGIGASGGDRRGEVRAGMSLRVSAWVTSEGSLQLTVQSTAEEKGKNYAEFREKKEEDGWCRHPSAPNAKMGHHQVLGFGVRRKRRGGARTKIRGLGGGMNCGFVGGSCNRKSGGKRRTPIAQDGN